MCPRQRAVEGVQARTLRPSEGRDCFILKRRGVLCTRKAQRDQQSSRQKFRVNPCSKRERAVQKVEGSEEVTCAPVERAVEGVPSEGDFLVPSRTRTQLDRFSVDSERRYWRSKVYASRQHNE